MWTELCGKDRPLLPDRELATDRLRDLGILASTEINDAVARSVIYLKYQQNQATSHVEVASVAEQSIKVTAGKIQPWGRITVSNHNFVSEILPEHAQNPDECICCCKKGLVEW